MSYTMLCACRLAAATHPAIGVRSDNGVPVFYATLDERAERFIEHRDIAAVLSAIVNA